MIPTSDALNKWLLHIDGQVRLSPKLGMQRLEEAVELNRDGSEITSRFGAKQFEAMVGFIDMRGFSEHARGKSPSQVRDIAAPFVNAIVTVATKHQWFIDKTIGDEVMIVLPSFNTWEDALSDSGLKPQELWMSGLSTLLQEIMLLLADQPPDRKFSAGFAKGQVILDRVGSTEYGEWTVYGNAVNAAKRLQALCGECQHLQASNNKHLIAVGAIVADEPKIKDDLNVWLQLLADGPLRLSNSRIDDQECKGVGRVCFVATEASAHK